MSSSDIPFPFGQYVEEKAKKLLISAKKFQKTLDKTKQLCYTM